MKITRSLVWTFARMWGRGFMRGASTFYVVYFPFILRVDLLGAFEHYPWLTFTVGPLLFILWAILAPLYLSISDLGYGVNRQQVKSIETRIDETAALVGVNWAETCLLEVDKLLEEGSTDAARKVFHRHAGGTWDQAYFALANWPSTLLVKKLELIQHKLNSKC